MSEDHLGTLAQVWTPHLLASFGLPAWKAWIICALEKELQ